jgi:4'-phosphopantetheinyl transferase EntD
MGVYVDEIPRSPKRYPVWPLGIVGSIAHDGDFAAAVVGTTASIKGIGIDIEPAERLPAGVTALVASGEEMLAFSDFEFPDKALFSIKEAVFKAAFPTDEVFMDFQDVHVARRSLSATTVYGRSVNWRILERPRILAIAWL